MNTWIDWRIKTEKQKILQKNPLSLAYLGDAVYEVMVRDYIMNFCDVKTSKMHKISVNIVSAPAQSKALALIRDVLTNEEKIIVKKGKNSKSPAPKNATFTEYSDATALETLFGYLSLSGQEDRIKELFAIISKNQIKSEVENSLNNRQASEINIKL
ncbi:MAG: ribonuclease III [Ruminococcaceae bacterium]|nr:ribonuclease III [Oscillospiraceae bacterium]